MHYLRCARTFLTWLPGSLAQALPVFAVNVLIGWYADGVDVQARLPGATFLGHASPEATYWYLQASPQLLALAASGSTPATLRAGTRPRTG